MVEKELTKKAKRYRREILDLGIKMNSSHIAPAFSLIDIVALLYEEILTKKDKFVLSKGHGCLGLYVMLHHCGFKPKLSGHPDIQIEEGIECTTGSLGHGLPIAVGMALAKKLKKEKGEIFVLMGDGECQEGTTWESLLIASHNKLNNLTIIIDRNRLQSLDNTENILALDDLKKKFEAFNFWVLEIDGHDRQEISEAVRINSSLIPKIILANTIKGKGLSFMENKSVWHTKLPEAGLLKQAYEELK